MENTMEGGGAPKDTVAQAISAFGKLDSVVNNAGFQPTQPFRDISKADFNHMLDINLTAPHLVTLALADHLVERDVPGSIVHVASIEGTQPAVDHAHYNASKAALLMHCRSAAMDLGPHGIRVNAVSPGLIEREGIAEAWPDGVGRWLSAVPLGRMGTADEVGDACLFLLSQLAKWVTGINLVVDGGMSIRPTY